MDENNQHLNIFTYKFDEDVLGSTLVSRDSKYFIFNVSNKLTIFTFDIHQKQLAQIYQDNSSQQQINVVTLNQKQSKVYVIKDSIDLYIISLKDFAIQKGQLDQQQVVISFFVSSDDSWICLSQDAVGIMFYQIISLGQNQIFLRLACTNTLINSYNYLLIKNDSILITIDYWIGISIFDITELAKSIDSGQSNIQMKALLLNWWIDSTYAPYSNALEINLEETFLFVAFRSVGFYIFDIQNPSQPQIVQLIQIQKDIIQIIQSYKNPYVYIQTKKRILVYKKVKANFQNNYPNLFNKHASILSTLIDTSQTKQIKLLPDNSHMIVCCSSNGLNILKLKLNSILQPLEIVSQINYSSKLDSFLIFSNGQLLILSVQDPNSFYFDIYDLGNLISPQRVQRIILDYKDINSITLSKDETLFVFQSGNNLVFYEVSSIQFKYLNTFNINSSPIVQQSSIVILNEFPYILVLIQEQSITAIQISNLNEPQISSVQESLGAVYGIQGTYQSHFCFIADGQQGISIIDLRELPNIVIMTKISLNGYQVNLILLQNDNYIISSQQSGGQIELINIFNINEPYIMSQTQFENESSVATEISQDLNYLFILSSKGIRILPIKTSFLINFEFSLLQDTNSGQQQQTMQGTENLILEVGQNLIVTLTSIYPQKNAAITNAYFVQQYKLQTLPSWLSFDNHLNQLQINVTKESLTGLIQNNNTNIQINFNNVVFVTKVQLTETSFIYQDNNTGSYIITDVQSKQIFQYFKNYNILNGQNQISDQFCQNESFDLPSLSKMTISNEGYIVIRNILQSSVVYSPLKLLLQNSLIVNFKNPFQIISSVSKIASMSIQIDKISGKFVLKNYPGVITLFSKDQDMLQLEGEIIYLNQILTQQILVYFYSNTYTKSNVEVILDDKINYQYDQFFLYQDIQNIFQIKKNIQIQSTQSFQAQVNRIFSDSIIYIDTLNTIQFSFNTYEYTDFKDLTFQAFEIKGGNLKSLSAQIDEISFFPQQLMFIIKPQISDYSSSFCFIVNATNSYSWVQDQFCVKAKGLLKYWYLLFNLIFAKKNKYKEVQLSSGQEFTQKIILVNDSYIICKKLFNKFKQQLKTQKKQQDYIQNSQKDNILCQSQLNRETDYSKDKEFLSFQNINSKKLSNLIINVNKKLDKCIKSKYKGSYEEFDQYINHQNCIDKQKFFADFEKSNLQISYNKKKLSPQQFKKDLEDEDSIIYNCIYGESQLLKQSSFKEKQTSKNTWIQIQQNKNSLKNSNFLNQNNQNIIQKLYNLKQTTDQKALRIKAIIDNQLKEKNLKNNCNQHQQLLILMVQKSLKTVLILALALFVLIKTTVSLAIKEIYVSTIFKNFESTSNQQYFKQIAVAKKAGLIYFKQGQSTINIYDENNNFNQLCSYQPQGQLKDNFLVSDDGKFLIVVLENFLKILEFNLKTKILSILFTDVQQSQFNILSLNQQQNKIYLIRDQVNFQIISLVDFSIAKGILNNQWQVLDMHISNDEKWLSVSANTQGLFFYQINKSDNSTIQFSQVSSNSNVNFYQFILFKNDKYIIGLDYWQGISIFDLTTFAQELNQGNTNIQLNTPVINWWMVQGGFPYSSTIEINQEQSLIYVGARSSGIYAVDITNILNPVVFQLIQIQEDIFQLILSYNLSYLYLSTKKSVVVYQKDQVNLQMSYPNLYNKHQSTLSSILNTPYGWRSLLLKDEKTLIVTCSKYGVVIAQFNQTSIQIPLQVLSTISYPFLTYSDNIMLFREETFLLVPVQDPSGYIIDVYDISNKTSPKVVQRIPSQTSAYIYSMSKKQDETLFGCQNLNQLAFYIVSGNISFNLISSFSIPQSLSTVQTNDMVILNGFPYVILLFRALTIAALDISDVQKPFIASNIDSLGAEQIIQGTYQRNYCFIADGLQGISVIDLTQLPKIVIISNVQISGYTNFLNLIVKEQFIITSQLSGGELSLVSMSAIKSPQFISQLQYKNEFAAASSLTSDSSCQRQHRYFKSNKIKASRLNSFNPLYPISGSQITNAYFVRDGILYDLPSWMVFDIYKSTLTLSITKDSLNVIKANNLDNNDITKQTVVFVTKLPLTQNSFAFTNELTGNVAISQNMSQQIFIAYKNMGIINHLNQVSDSFAEDETFTPPMITGLNLTDDAILKIKKVLQMSLTYSPVDLLLQKSLIIDFMQDNNYIQSCSPSVSILFTVNQKDGKFVNRLYSSVVTSLTEKQDQLQLQGNIKSLNQLLQQQIQIYLYDKNSTNVNIQIQVSDGINNDFVDTYTFDQLSKILQIKKDLSISLENKLQNQINNQYPGSHIQIGSQVDIEFSLNTFNDANFNDLQFQAFQFYNDQYIPLTNQQNEIQFIPQQFKFNIKTSISDFGRKYCLAVNVTDSYSWVIDSFCATASVISFIVFLNIFLQVFGPLLFFLGILKYWNLLFNMFFNKENLFKKQIEENKQFVLKFIIVNDSYLIGQKLFNEYVKNIPQSRISQKSIQVYQSPHNSSLLKNYILKLNLKNDEILQKNSNIDQQELQINDFEFTKEQKDKAKQILRRATRILNSKRFNIKTFITDLYNSNKPINYGGKVIYPRQLQNELNDSGSVLYNCLSGLLIKSLLKLNKRTFVVYQLIKQIAQICYQKSQKQWTEFLTESFPILMQKNMKKSALQNSNELNAVNIKQLLGIDLGLIIDNIITDAIGIVNPTNSSLYPNSGESIHLLEHKIKKVQAFMKSKNSKTFCLKKLLNMEYQPLFSHKNQQLPSWLKIKIENQLITLYGIVPQMQNYGKLKICIFDCNECIIREVILEMKNNNSKQKSQLNITNDISIIESEQASPLNIYGYSEVRDKLSHKKLKLFETMQQPILQNNNIKVFTFEQLCSDNQLNVKTQNKIQKSNVQQLNRTIIKSINPLLIDNNVGILE
ncbi:transmembrane protein, putative (macronuclear) [Tetrahymena thermophila SB210]|uniref:Transmembrane protein, putative n=1 Tax=Tetrahymena thermophila (strain SB210) TaxID=312017 RepID=W7XEA0_TETTS|nr:transmembrane protein, putative [Tetrahymena thermophila SB210]EWS75997.1 transmembrane protein, putative [Tetrahymena thermophila SB210]|eukprot:XP_012651515.1 transmembrane protein, putative [Tetrahymena thermophila SB210]